MNPITIAEKFTNVLVQQLDVSDSEVTPDALFGNDLRADSLDTIEIVMACEEEFGIEIPDEDAEKITRVKDAIEYLERRLAEKKAPAANA